MTVELAAGEAVYSGFINGVTPARLPDGAPPIKNVANTNVGIFDDRLLVYFEGGLPFSLDPQTLQTLGTHDFHGGIGMLCTARVKPDPPSGDLLFFAAMGPLNTWYRADATTGPIVDSPSFEIGVPVLMHDFAVSENYAIFFVTPALMRFDLAAQGLPGVVWDEAAVPDGVRVALMHRRTHEVTWHTLGAHFSNTHFFNAYERDGELIIDGHRITRLGTPPTGSTPPSGHTNGSRPPCPTAGGSTWVPDTRRSS